MTDRSWALIILNFRIQLNKSLNKQKDGGTIRYFGINFHFMHLHFN